MRLRSDIWVKAYIRGCSVKGVMAVVVRHGDDDAGAIFIKINRLDGTASLYGPAPAGLDDAGSERQWVRTIDDPVTREADVDARLHREAEFDSDLWIIEVEDREGRHYLDDWLAARG